MRLIFTDLVGLMTHVRVILYQKKTADDIVPTAGFEFYVTDAEATRYQDLANTDPQALKNLIMKKKSDVNPPVIIDIGNVPELDNMGKLKDGQTFTDTDADYTDESDLR